MNTSVSNTRSDVNKESKEQGSAPSHSVEQKIDWRDYRDHLSTAEKDGSRRWLYPKQPHGKFYAYRTWVSWILLVSMFVGPFIRINGNPLLMMNIVDRRFSILGQIFWPQDTILFAVAMLCFLTGIIIFTTAFGRLWCGWACPQTVLMEMVFRKIEYWIEGDSVAQRALTASPWTKTKFLKRIGKHALFFILSFLIGNTLLSYIIGSDALFEIILDDPRQHLTGLTFMILFTFLFYGIFARFREQACTFICPYGRFQSAMLDENTVVVAYDHKRGEQRGPLRREQTIEDRQADGLGDCIQCRQCVAVCPTGIDIRDGTQMECVNCTACIDACDEVMDKVGQPRGLIRFASYLNIERGEKQKFTPRMGVYLVILSALIGLFLLLVFTRSDVETSLLRAPGSMFQLTVDGKISNLFTMKVINKTNRDLPIELRLENMDGSIRVMGVTPLIVPETELKSTSVLVELDLSDLQGHFTPIEMGVYSGGERLETLKSKFIGPRNPSD